MRIKAIPTNRSLSPCVRTLSRLNLDRRPKTGRYSIFAVLVVVGVEVGIEADDEETDVPGVTAGAL